MAIPIYINDKELHRLNILEILDNWNGYPLQPYCYQDVAKNFGTVEIRCYINNFCPFTKVDPVDDSIVFNERTLERILPSFPAKYRNALTTTPGTEGIHFVPRYVFRNNYIYKLKNNFSSLPSNYEEEIHKARFDEFYEEINEGRGQVLAADDTRYKIEQTWVVVPSVFDDPAGYISCSGTTPESCQSECTKANWSYFASNEEENNAKLEDVRHDYSTITYNRYRDTLIQNSNGEWGLIKGEKPVILPDRVQMPVQNRTTDSLTGKGIHWRLKKRTPLYRGEDFFIKFYKKAKATTAKKSSFSIPKFNIDKYRPLDVTETATVVQDTRYPELDMPRNLAVKPLATGGDIGDTKYYDLSSQAYYVIEMGADGFSKGSSFDRENYFIIITERTYPICVSIEGAFLKGTTIWSDGGVSKPMGEPFKGITGKQLIDSPYFKMTVRNHLGSLIIEFEGPGFKTDPWIINKEIWELEKQELENGVYSNYPVLTKKPSIMVVPRGYMSIWGGNLQCGFLFGPLQYAGPEAGFIYPPKSIETEEEATVSINTSGGLTITGDSGLLSNPFFLPKDVKHYIKFSLPDIDRYEFEKETASGGNDFIIGDSRTKIPMFTQDAQFFRDFLEERNGDYTYEEYYGSYYYRQTLKEIGYTTRAFNSAKTSGLTVQKFRRINDETTRHQAFDIAIHMLVGDHVFSLQGVSYEGGVDAGGLGRGVWVANRGGSLADYEWLLADCKTPIMTGLRLIADGGNSPRWDDGTLLKRGIALTPYDNNSPYFIDASDHVLNYSESWSATDFTQVDHTGTINFLLTGSLPFGKNVTDKLYSLQNKTFYIEIWAGFRDCNYSKLPGFYKMFTGLCHGGKIDYEYGKIIMSCKIVDYTEILKDTLFFNSPFFDGMRDINAVYEILKMTGFRQEGALDPLNLVYNLKKGADSNTATIYFRNIDGRSFKMEPYTLPSGYDRLSQPMFKFNDGMTFLDGIREISKKSAKVFYFDQLGIAHYEDLGDLIEQDFQGRMPLYPSFRFTTNPQIFPGQMVFNKVEHNYVVEDIYNHIKMMSNTPDYHLLLYDTLNWSSIDNPEVEGFLGYRKTYYQQEALFGSKAALLHAAYKYSVKFRPYVIYNFETYGVPLRSNDIIQINGENARVMEVGHVFDPEKNQWWMTVMAKRYQPIAVAVRP